MASHIVSTNSFASNLIRSSMRSPTPIYNIGSSSSLATPNSAPPFEVPSNFVIITPSILTISLKAFA